MSPTHNKDLKALLNQITRKVDSSTSVDDLIQAIGYARDFGSPLKYDNAIPNTIAVIGFLVSAIIIFMITVPKTITLNEFSITGTFLLLIAAFIATIFGASRNFSVSTLSSEIFYKNLLFDNGLEIREDKTFLDNLESTFHEFDRGNSSREFRQLLKGNYADSEHSFQYHFYHFHYVDSRTVTETVSDGKGGTRIQTRTVYDHYDRYGIVTQFDLVKNVAILEAGASGIKGGKYTTASNRFNNKYNVVAETEFLAAKFLKPSVVVEIEDFSARFNGLNYEFNGSGRLCLSFEDEDLIAAKQVYGLDSPSEFINEISEKTSLEKLDFALKHIHTLIKYSDNNFTERSV